jgi:mono/diheme cytochrome c family protein
MRIASGIVPTIAFGLAMAVAGTSGTFAAHKMAAHKASASTLVAKGHALAVAKHCNTCHAANFKGKPGFSPSLTSTGVLKEYNPKTWDRVMNTGITNDGKPVKKPMPVYHLSAADSNALWAYFKTLK